MKRRSALAGTLVAASLMGGCGNAAPEVPAELQSAFSTTQEYWHGQGITHMGTLALQMSKGETGKCGDSLAVSPLAFCFNANEVTGRIVVDDDHYKGEIVRAKSANISEKALAAAAIGHEYGHALTEMEYARSADTEPTADCLAGVVVEATHPGLTAPAAEYLSLLGGSDYGDRSASFMRGAQGGVSACNPALPTLLGMPAAMPSGS